MYGAVGLRVRLCAATEPRSRESVSNASSGGGAREPLVHAKSLLAPKRAGEACCPNAKAAIATPSAAAFASGDVPLVSFHVAHAALSHRQTIYSSADSGKLLRGHPRYQYKVGCTPTLAATIRSPFQPVNCLNRHTSRPGDSVEQFRARV